MPLILNRTCTILLVAGACLLSGTLSLHAQKARVSNIVLVHGAWVDGSGWKPVYEILAADGYTVTLVQEPLTSFAQDVAATKRVLAEQNGPCILVGHSYGGSVILKPVQTPTSPDWSISPRTC